MLDVPATVNVVNREVLDAQGATGLHDALRNVAGVVRQQTHVYPRDTTMGWGVPARAATVIATLQGEPDKAVVFGYERGATMDCDFIAPARRVALFLDNESFPQLSPQGRKLFDAAIDWAVAKP